MSHSLGLVVFLFAVNISAGQQVPRFEDFGTPSPRNGTRGSAEWVEDMDGDGLPDLVWPTLFGFQISWNDGDGGFGSFVPYTIRGYASGGYLHFAVADLDDDGDCDVVCFPAADLFTGPLPMFLMENQGGRQFAPDFSVFPWDFRGEYLHSAFPGDFDGDGLEDLVVIGGDELDLLRRVGPLRFVHDPQAFPDVPGSLVDSTAGLVADFDGDGDLDFLHGRGFNSPRQDMVYVNDGSGSFSPGFAFPAMDPVCLDMGDLDGDGDIDVVNATTFGRRPIWLNDGQGQFVDASDRVGTLPPTTMWRASHVALRDIDADGDLDVLFTSVLGVEIWINDGRGQFTDISANYGWTQPAAGLRVADLDRDGDLDISFSGAWESRVFKNLTRHVHAPDPIRGSPWSIDLYSTPGWTVTYAVGFGRASLPIAPYGWWGLDPSMTVAFPGGLTVPASGQVTSTLPVPNDAALRGLEIFVQAIELDVATANSIRLTNTDGSVIR